MSRTTSFPRLLGDVGGTNARLAWQAEEGAGITDVMTYPAAQYASLQAAIERYLADHGKPAPRWCVAGFFALCVVVMGVCTYWVVYLDYLP